MKTETQARLMRIKQLTAYINVSRGYIYEKINEGTFPPGVMISSGVRAWDKKIVDFWISKKMEKERDDEETNKEQKPKFHYGK